MADVEATWPTTRAMSRGRDQRLAVMPGVGGGSSAESCGTSGSKIGGGRLCRDLSAVAVTAWL